MANFNKVILIGNITKNPEVRELSGTRIAKSGIAVNRKYKSGDEKKEETLFIDFVAFGRLAEIIGEYVTKGNPLMIEGRLKLNQWEKDGHKMSKHEIVAENIQLLSSGQAKPAGEKDYSEDDIPF